MPVSSRKRRENVRTLIRTWPASSASESGRCSSSSAQARVADVLAAAGSGTGRWMYCVCPPSRQGGRTAGKIVVTVTA
jgi:hypothetical protein